MSRVIFSFKFEDSENDTSGTQFRLNQGQETIITAIKLHYSVYRNLCKGKFVPSTRTVGTVNQANSATAVQFKLLFLLCSGFLV